MRRINPMAFGLGTFAVALGLTVLLWKPVFSVSGPFTLFFAAIAISAWYGGLRSGALVSILSVIACAVLQYPELPWSSLAARLVVALLICWLAETRLTAQRAAAQSSAESGQLSDALKKAQAELERRVTERTEQLRQSEERFRLLVSDVQDYAIIMLDENGIVRSWNRGAQRLKGYSAVEIIGQHFSKFYSQAEIDDKKPERQLAAAVRDGRVEDEGWRVRKDGSQFWANVVITALRDAEGNLRGFAKVTRDMTAQRSAEQAREALLREQVARAEAEKANRIKDEFLSIVSHELRTPLTPIVGWTRILLKSEMERSELVKGLTVIDRNAKAQVRLIDDLLDVSRIISGKIKLEFKTISLCPVIEAAMDAVRPAADARQIKMLFVLEDSVGPVWADPMRLQQIVWNFLTNSVKFTPSGGRIEIRLRRTDGKAHMEVTDNGEGIEPEYLPHVFERFSQFDSTTTRKFGGLGIGLSIVKQLVELHGGSVWASSAGRGKGATFTLELPLQPQTAHVQDASPMPAYRIADLGLKDKLILVVDDEADSREILQMALSRTGAHVLTASSADEALEILAANEINVLVSDIGMPGKDGYELIHRLRETGQKVPAIAVTAYARSEDRTRALSEGFARHVSKPVDPEELCAAVSACLN